MKGYAYMDNDRNLHFRYLDFIENQDPQFWTRNAHFIDVVWKIDTTDTFAMTAFLTSLKNRNLSVQVVKDFCKAIEFDVTEFLKTNFQVKSDSSHFSKPPLGPT